MMYEGHICKPEPIKSSLSAIGTSFFWDGTNFQAFEYGRNGPLSLPNTFMDVIANYLESHQLPASVALCTLDAKQVGDRKGAVSDPQNSRMEQRPISSMFGPSRELLMERLDYVTNSHIVEEVAEIQPTGGYPVAF